MLGVLSLLPTALSYAVAAGIRLVPTRPPTLSRIGARDAVRNRSRTAATTGALLLATAVVAGLAVFLASFARSVDGDVGRLVRSDLVVDSETFTQGGLPGDLLVELDELPETSAVSGWQVGRVTAGATPMRVTGVDGDADRLGARSGVGRRLGHHDRSGGHRTGSDHRAGPGCHGR